MKHRYKPIKHRYRQIYKKFVNANTKTKEVMYNRLYEETEQLSELLTAMSEHIASGVVKDDGDL